MRIEDDDAEEAALLPVEIVADDHLHHGLTELVHERRNFRFGRFADLLVDVARKL